MLGEEAEAKDLGKARPPVVLAGLLAFVAVAGILALLVWGMARPSGSAQAGTGVNTVGGASSIAPHPASDLRLTLFDGKGTPWSLSDQRGKKVVINFWASWCQPCRTEASVLAGAASEYATRNVMLVGVNVWDDRQSAQRFIDEFGLRYPNGRDEEGAAAIEFGVTGIPETFVVDEEGMITARWVGPLRREALDKLVGVSAR
jgi:cytochrome c biogenesis protein CcmG/thiol:disulfide interchange protein DsbE